MSVSGVVDAAAVPSIPAHGVIPVAGGVVADGAIVERQGAGIVDAAASLSQGPAVLDGQVIEDQVTARRYVEDAERRYAEDSAALNGGSVAIDGDAMAPISENRGQPVGTVGVVVLSYQYIDTVSRQVDDIVLEVAVGLPDGRDQAARTIDISAGDVESRRQYCGRPALFLLEAVHGVFCQPIPRHGCTHRAIYVTQCDRHRAADVQQGDTQRQRYHREMSKYLNPGSLHVLILCDFRGCICLAIRFGCCQRMEQRINKSYLSDQFFATNYTNFH